MMTPFKGRILTLVLALLGGTVPAPSVRAAVDQVTFHFAPPVDTAYLAVSKITTSRPVRGKIRASETEIVSRLRITRAGEGPFATTFSVVSASSRIDGTPVETPLLQILPGLDLTFEVGADGKILGLTDFAGLSAQAKKKATPELFAAASPFLTAESILGRRRAATNPLLTGLVGKTLTAGEKTTFPGSVSLPTGETFPVRFTVALRGSEPTTDCGRCVRIDFTAEPVSESAKPAAAPAAGATAGAPAVATVGATAHGTALVDPATLLTWSLKSEEAITMEEPGTTTLMTVTVTVEDSLAQNHPV
jgi:hypothetical protein